MRPAAPAPSSASNRSRMPKPWTTYSHKQHKYRHSLGWTLGLGAWASRHGYGLPEGARAPSPPNRLITFGGTLYTSNREDVSSVSPASPIDASVHQFVMRP